MRSIHSILGAAIAMALHGGPAFAADVRLVGVFPTRAVVSIDGGPPRTLAIGASTQEGVRLMAIESDAAIVEIDGKRRTLKIGQYVGSAAPSETGKIVLAAGRGGHFMAAGRINGGPIQFMVDTGASAIAISTDDARRLGINYLSAPRGVVQTANGSRGVWRVTLDSVSVGTITVHGVDAMILDGGLGTPLLGMSFLSRMNMQQAGDTLTLTKRY